jgi:hypothetical protein
MKKEWLWAILALAIAVVLAYTLLSLSHDAQSKVPYDCVDPTERERIRQLAFDGIDKGLVSAMAHLFDIWQRDPENSQPKRAQVGTTNAINAHIRARKLAFAWDPPSCPKEP